MKPWTFVGGGIADGQTLWQIPPEARESGLFHVAAVADDEHVYTYRVDDKTRRLHFLGCDVAVTRLEGFTPDLGAVRLAVAERAR